MARRSHRGGNRDRNRGGGGRREGGSGSGSGSGYDNNANGGGASRLSDEEVMIAFLPHLRSGNPKAVALHAELGQGDHRRFIDKAREFLVAAETCKDNKEDAAAVGGGGGGADGRNACSAANLGKGSAPAPQAPPPPPSGSGSGGETGPPAAGLDRYHPAVARAELVGQAASSAPAPQAASAAPVRPQPARPQPMPVPARPLQRPPQSSAAPPQSLPGIGGGGFSDAFGGLSLGGAGGGATGNPATGTLGGGLGLGGSSFGGDLGGAPSVDLSGAGRATGRLGELGPAFASPPPPPPRSSLPMPANNPPGLHLQKSQIMPGSIAAHPATHSADQRPPQSIPPTPGASTVGQGASSSVGFPATPVQTTEGGTAGGESKLNKDGAPPTTSAPRPPPTTPAKPAWQPRRTHTRPAAQAGIVSCDGVRATPSDPRRHLVIGPRTQIRATWSLPLSHLRERAVRRLREEGRSSDEAGGLTIRDALAGLTVGLFRRGCSENGDQHSIVSKDIVPIDHHGDDAAADSSRGNQGPKDGYQFEVRHDLRPPSVVGTVPFYTPRTPGNVVLRLYYRNDAVVTLATGPLVRVEATDAQLEPTLRFVLSNFKAKAGTANFTCLHNYAAVLEQFRPAGEEAGPSRDHYNRRGGPRNVYDGAGRAAFGCLAESRKVVHWCFDDYTKKRTKLANQERELQHIIDNLPPPTEGEEEEEDPGQKETALPTELEVKMEEMKEVNKQKASMERKWKEIQLAYYSILKVREICRYLTSFYLNLPQRTLPSHKVYLFCLFTTTQAAHRNRNAHLLLRREVLSQIALEFDLFCPLCEAFAPSPFGGAWGIGNCPRTITQHHFDAVNKARMNMQQEVLGFVPRQISVSSILHGNYPEVRSATKDPKTVLDQVSTSMIQLYDSKYRVTAEVANLREQCRKTVEAVVASCNGVFPAGTRVVVFGSCANGFGSPSSDLDMCLQLPPNTSLPTIGEEAENNGAAAMAKLAEKLNEVGLEDVDTVRLTARIPVLMFNYPIITPSGEKILLDCDLSMQNPLACLNTSLLLSYATISPQTRVLVSIIKRWAKTRDINSPQFHTLSSYGYILMLLHFLTHHATTVQGNVVPYYEGDARRGGQYLENQPLLPNLQWMDPSWPHSPRGTAYSEMREKPKQQSCLMPHPTETSFTVNAHFYRVADQAQKDNLKQRFAPTQSGFDPSVAILLAEFFRYYAFCFDFKKHVVSLNTNYGAGLIEKEAKAESDAWSVYRQILAIEDPFETFYDVAHVLKPGTFQRVKREFAMAYSKLADAMTGNRDASWSGGVDLHAMSGDDVVEWLCEPLSSEEEE